MIRRILDALTLSALRMLRITERLFRPDPVEAIVSLVSRSGCSLQELILNSYRPPEEYQNALPSLSSISYKDKQDVDCEDSDSEEEEDDQ
jgi:hypothetical protein